MSMTCRGNTAVARPLNEAPRSKQGLPPIIRHIRHTWADTLAPARVPIQLGVRITCCHTSRPAHLDRPIVLDGDFRATRSLVEITVADPFVDIEPFFQKSGLCVCVCVLFPSFPFVEQSIFVIV